MKESIVLKQKTKKGKVIRLKDLKLITKAKDNRGITLIALIITIIILVILAAVSVRSVFQMGIVEYAINGSQEYASKANEENAMFGQIEQLLDESLSNINSISSATTPTTVDVAQAFEDETYTWTDLGNMAKIISGEFGTTTGKVNKTTDSVEITYNGQKVRLTVGDEFALSDGTNDYTVRILGFNTDKLAENGYDIDNYNSSNDYYAGITFGFTVPFAYNRDTWLKAMNSTQQYSGGWEASQMKTDLNGASGVRNS